uniref:Uncharacterized protein n=1 Tax=Oryza nivara TaxID=4536 RepID=A0A0E0ITI9_ORYNI
MAMQRVAAEAVEGISVHDIATSTSGGETEGGRGLPRRLAARSRGGSGQTRRLWQLRRRGCCLRRALRRKAPTGTNMRKPQAMKIFLFALLFQGKKESQLVSKTMPRLKISDPLSHLGSESSMVILQLVGELIDNILDFESKAPDLLYEDASGIVGVLELLSALKEGLHALQFLLHIMYLSEEACKGRCFLAEQ